MKPCCVLYTIKLREAGLGGWIIVNGSFVTAKENPGDIDVILVIGENYDLAAPVSPLEKRILSQEYVKDAFELHLFVEGTAEAYYSAAIEKGLESVMTNEKQSSYEEGKRSNKLAVI